MGETTTEPDLVGAIDALTVQLRELLEACGHQIITRPYEEGDALTEHLRELFEAWGVFLAAIRAAP